MHLLLLKLVFYIFLLNYLSNMPIIIKANLTSFYYPKKYFIFINLIPFFINKITKNCYNDLFWFGRDFNLRNALTDF